LQAGVAGASVQREQWRTIILATGHIGMRRLEQRVESRRRRQARRLPEDLISRLVNPQRRIQDS